MLSPRDLLLQELKAKLQPRASDVHVPSPQAASPPGLAASDMEKRILDEFMDVFDSMWQASNPHTVALTPEQTLKVEVGCWVIYNPQTDQLRLQHFPQGTRASLLPDMPTGVAGERVVSFFHTHPNSYVEGYSGKPSGGDIAFAQNWGVRGVVRAHTGGWHWFP